MLVDAPQALVNRRHRIEVARGDWPNRVSSVTGGAERPDAKRPQSFRCGGRRRQQAAAGAALGPLDRPQDPAAMRG
jgi:hypothetical protein